MSVGRLLADLRRELRPLGVLAEAYGHLMSGIEEEIASGAPAAEAE